MTDQKETDPEAPKIEFPCDYPIKVIAVMGDQLVPDINAIMLKYDAGLDLNQVVENPSGKGNYVSIRYPFRATGEAQLQALFAELKQNPNVKMVL